MTFKHRLIPGIALAATLLPGLAQAGQQCEETWVSGQRCIVCTDTAHPGGSSTICPGLKAPGPGDPRPLMQLLFLGG